MQSIASTILESLATAFGQVLNKRYRMINWMLLVHRYTEGWAAFVIIARDANVGRSTVPNGFPLTQQTATLQGPKSSADMTFFVLAQ